MFSQFAQNGENKENRNRGNEVTERRLRPQTACSLPHGCSAVSNAEADPRALQLNRGGPDRRLRKMAGVASHLAHYQRIAAPCGQRNGAWQGPSSASAMRKPPLKLQPGFCTTAT